MNAEIRINKKIKLHKANMIVGLSGWGNGGEVSTLAVKYLAEKLGAKKFGDIPHEKFHDYFIQRPTVLIEHGLMQSYVSPRNDLLYWKNKESGTDLVLLLGSEPHLDWPRYAKNVHKLAEETDVGRIYTIGGYLADISHQIKTPITASTNNKKLLGELKKAEVELTSYEGPTSVYSEILWRSRESKIDVVSLWCAVPMYVKGSYPVAIYFMLKKITELIGLKLDLEDLKNEAESFKIQLEKETMDQLQPDDSTETLRRQRERRPS